MNDPHVVALLYRIKHGDSIDYSQAKPLVVGDSRFKLTVEDKRVRFEFKTHYATEEQACKCISEYIRLWEFDATLKRGNQDSFRLVFEKAEMIDRNGTPRLSTNFKAGGGVGSARLTLCVCEYPPPPSDIALNADVETMYQRYMGYRKKHEPLQSMAYFCLSMLEDSPAPRSQERKRSRKRLAAASKYQIEEGVLVEIGRLSSTKGGREARKAGGVATELSPQERHFMTRAVKAIIRRAAEKAHAPDVPLPTISLSNLPSLNGETDLG